MQVGDKIQLKKLNPEVVKCEADGCGHLMVNIDADQVEPGDLLTLKQAGVRISNPETDKPICVSCEYKTLGRKLADWWEEEDDDDDSGFFNSGGSFLGSSGLGGFSGGGFGGFGGGSFGGGGASRGF